MKRIYIVSLLLAISLQAYTQEIYYVFQDITSKNIKTGAERIELYLPYIKHKKVAVCTNHTGMIGSKHLVDSLLSLYIEITKIFSPEHGFRGEAEAGKRVNHSVDKQTGIPIVSLYGQHKKPDSNDLKNVNIILFDIQDVGARFYTYISTLHYIMEAAAEHNIPVIVLDRPNPNGYWVDGPVLEKKHTSFVGMHPVPIVHGMTIGEYAKMINGEQWLADGKKCLLQVVPMKGYHHTFRYQLPIHPSPNLSSMTAIYLYPTLCLLEGTPLSIGRGTDKPFCIVGYPNLPIGNYTFTPKDIPNVATNVPCKNKKCTGYDLTTLGNMIMKNKNFINVDIIIELYNNFPDKNNFFTPFFDKLAGSDTLRKQIIAGKSAEEIRESWKEELNQFKLIRKKYLLYGDFE
ncbi:MAG: DUF1343 domain-containing protein [Bacteroidales bacterium]